MEGNKIRYRAKCILPAELRSRSPSLDEDDEDGMTRSFQQKRVRD